MPGADHRIGSRWDGAGAPGGPPKGQSPARAAPARIARALGVREETIQRLVRGDARTISPEPVTR